MKSHIGFSDPAKIAESRERKCKGCIFERRNVGEKIKWCFIERPHGVRCDRYAKGIKHE